MSPLTIYLARVLGIYCIVIAVGMLACRRTVLPVIDDMLKNGPLLFVVGAFAMIIGIAMVVGHNVWGGGAATIIVTLIGWLSLAKGVALAFTPQETMLRFYRAMDYERRFPLLMIGNLMIGLYLAASGFRLI